MPTLLLRLCGPMQSWGTQSRFTERDTEREPSKSGVIGLVCAALGWPRDRDVTPLAELRMGVRVDREGVLASDYHTAGAKLGVARAGGGVSRDAVLSNRHFLQDADFLVGLEGDRALLEEIDAALRNPHWQLFLGRKSFVPTVPVALPGTGIRDSGLRQSLVDEPWPLVTPGAVIRRESPGRLRLVLETAFDNVDHLMRMDQPLGAAFQHREFGPRPIVYDYFEPEEDRNVPEQADA